MTKFNLALFLNLLLAMPLACERDATERYAPQRLIRTPEWGVRGILLLRQSREQDGTFLLRLLTHDEHILFRYGNPLPASAVERVVYRFRPGADKLEIVGLTEWDAGGPIAKQWRGDCDLGVDPHDEELIFGGIVVPTAGKLAISYAASPTDEWAAVLSVEGPRGMGFIGIPLAMGGRGIAKGKRYHQLFRCSDATAIGKPLILPFTANGADTLEAIWSPDGKYILYPEVFFRSIYIFPVGHVSAKPK